MGGLCTRLLANHTLTQTFVQAYPSYVFVCFSMPDTATLGPTDHHPGKQLRHPCHLMHIFPPALGCYIRHGEVLSLVLVG